MGTYNILDESGAVINTILAEEDFVEARWPGRWQLLPDPPSVVPVPSEVSIRQARLALLNANLLVKTDELIEAMEGTQGEIARIDWKSSPIVKRNWPFIALVGTELGLTEEDIDNLFISASNIPQ